MDIKLFFRAVSAFISGLFIVGALLFGSAGTFAFRKAWLLIAVLFIPMFAAGVVMMIRSPELLRKRLDLKERQSEQKEVVALSGLMFTASFAAAGFNVRFGWMTMPSWVSYAAAALFLAGYVLYAEVLRENMYLSRTVEVQEGQKVIDTGLYGVVRHPMYMSTLILFLSMPLVLGSPVSFLIMLLYVPVIVKRIRNEEQVLEEGLDGYRDYEKRVRHRIIPYIW